MNSAQLHQEQPALRGVQRRWTDTLWLGPVRVVQICLALLLLTAAGLKTHQLATEPVVGSGLLDSRWFLIAVVEFELFFAFWLLSGVFSFATWRVTVALFAVFSLVSLYKAVSGEASCGCFGTAEVNPWFTFVLDVLIVGCLLCWRPRQRGASRGVYAGRGLRVRLASVLVAWLCAGMSSGVVMASYQSTRLDDVGQLLGDGRTVLLEPETWIGKRFPLLDWIEIDGQLDKGHWIVVLHRPGCPDCEELLRRFAGNADIASSQSETCVALVTIRHQRLGVSHIPGGSRFVQGNLAETREWFVQTPVQIETMEGIVQRASVGRGGDEKRQSVRLAIPSSMARVRAVASARPQRREKGARVDCGNRLFVRRRPNLILWNWLKS